MLGFTEFERMALGSYFRLANREPRYVLVQMLTDADFLVADADHAPAVQLVAATDRISETVFIGSQAPPGAVAWMSRPIDALHVMRELDAMVSVQRAGPSQPAGSGSRVAPRRRSLLPPAPAPGDDGPAQDEAPPLQLREDLMPPTPAGFGPRADPTPRPVASTPWRKPMTRTLNPVRAVSDGGPQQPRALIVDDSAIAQRYLETRLLPWGLRVDRAAHSSRASELMHSHSYELVFLDVELGPGSELDGLALCQQIKHSVSAMNVSVILVSAHHTELDRVRGALAGCDAYLAKPLDTAELERLLLRHGLTPTDTAASKSRRRAAAAR